MSPQSSEFGGPSGPPFSYVCLSWAMSDKLQRLFFRETSSRHQGMKLFEPPPLLRVSLPSGLSLQFGVCRWLRGWCASLRAELRCAFVLLGDRASPLPPRFAPPSPFRSALLVGLPRRRGLGSSTTFDALASFQRLPVALGLRLSSGFQPNRLVFG